MDSESRVFTMGSPLRGSTKSATSIEECGADSCTPLPPPVRVGSTMDIPRSSAIDFDSDFSDFLPCLWRTFKKKKKELKLVHEISSHALTNRFSMALASIFECPLLKLRANSRAVFPSYTQHAHHIINGKRRYQTICNKVKKIINE